jgi:hypothetical protein
MKNAIMILFFVVTWRVQFTPFRSADGIPAEHRRTKNLETVSELRDFLWHMPQGSFECVDRNWGYSGTCKISEVNVK